MTVLNSAQKARGYVHYRVPNVEDIDHGNLAGLAEDDHPQYLNEARGDARYYTETEVDTLLAAQDELSELGDVTLTTPATGSVLYKSGTDWVNTDAVSIDPAGSVDLYHNGALAGGTYDQGLFAQQQAGNVAVKFNNSAGTRIGQFAITPANGDFFLDNFTAGAITRFRGKITTDGDTTLAVFDPNGSADLYYDGSKAFETASYGVQITDAANTGGTRLVFRDNAGNDVGQFRDTGTSFEASGRRNGGVFVLRASPAAGGLNNLLIGDPDGSVDLYYDGEKRLIVGDFGAFVRENAAQSNNPRFRIEQSNGTDAGDLIYVRADNSLRLRARLASQAVYVQGSYVRLDVLGTEAARTLVQNSGRGFILNSGAYVLSGGGTPEGVVTAPVGSIFLRTNGGAGTTFYVKESGTGNTGWVAK